MFETTVAPTCASGRRITNTLIRRVLSPTVSRDFMLVTDSESIHCYGSNVTSGLLMARHCAGYFPDDSTVRPRNFRNDASTAF